MNAIATPEIILNSIARQVKKLDPPVEKFEKSIRTSPFRILISVLLSSRTKDEVTMQASKKLFSVAATPEKLMKLSQKRVEELIYPAGFFRQKAKNIVEVARIIHEKSGLIPDSRDGLMSLPGIGRKSANLVLALVFNIPSIAVDIHVFRISKRLGWSRAEKPENVESDLKKIFEKENWNRLNKTLVGFGQTLCKPRNPACNLCNISNNCEFYISRSKVNPKEK